MAWRYGKFLVNSPVPFAATPMAESPPNQITQLLLAWSEGDDEAYKTLVPLVYEQLHRLAERHMRRERPGHTLQTTALVHELYMRLPGTKNLSWQNRAHFFAVSARMMRRILIDVARSKQNLKHGGGAMQVTLDEALAVSSEPSVDLIALDEALNRLTALHSRQAEIVEMRYFGGLREEEIAEVLKVSLRTVQQDWRLARLWLYRELKTGASDDA
jgi:RNA polymerase sigma-70 factor (ECF subfamily)